MAESVQYYLERMIPELEALEKKHIFSPVEIKSIIKKRTNFEYALQRRIKQKIDFLRSIEYEINLEDLRRKRVQRLGLQDALKGDHLQYSGARRIYNLFRRATTKFTGDISLWLQYIDYAKKNKANNILSGIFVQAIQFHPMNASLWIMTATWENEYNSNMAAARILLQRALRLMPQNQQLWHEYFRLELIYIEKIKLRRRVLGIEEEKGEDAMEVDNENDDDNTIKLPAVTGEDASKWKEDEGDDDEEKKKRTLDENDIAKLEESNNPILQGLLAKIIYDNAIDTIPSDIEFRKKFVDIYREFTNTETHIQHVYDTIRRDMRDVPAARGFLAARHLFIITKKEEGKKTQYISVNDPAFIPALKSCVEEFDEALKELNVSEMWEQYVKFLLNWFSLVSEANLKLYLCKLLQKTFKACKKANKMTMELYELWASFMIDIKEDKEDIERIVKQGLDVFPGSVKLWIKRAEFTSDGEEQLELYNRALEVNPDSLLLWTEYKDCLLAQSRKQVLDLEETEKLFFKACEKATLLLPSVLASSADRNYIKRMLQSSFVEWAAKTKGIDFARTVYKKIIKNFYPTYPFFMKCIEIENKYGNAETGPKFVEYLYDRTTRLEDDKEGTYISYLAYLYSQKKFQMANIVYNRACKELPNKDAFDIRVQKLKSTHTSPLTL
ncbi:hypothetical protein MFLAVUS_004071 [Mucor flavus]|uniref:U3 small nucleolar RNA-associated protein 6 n=1 Tax=Mucor flavus TaxID=439312 RepID=A0ABP9YUV5_9FUNG